MPIAFFRDMVYTFDKETVKKLKLSIKTMSSQEVVSMEPGAIFILAIAAILVIAVITSRNKK